MATANSIAKAFVGRNVDLIHRMATPTSQACVNATQKIPIVISSVTDPVGAGLVKSLEQPGGNVTGTTDRSPVDRQLELLREIQPKIVKLGFIYNAGEDNSVSSLKQLRKEAARHRIEPGDRLIMMHQGKIVLDVEGDRKRSLTIQKLMNEFAALKVGEMADDKMLLVC